MSHAEHFYRAAIFPFLRKISSWLLVSVECGVTPVIQEGLLRVPESVGSSPFQVSLPDVWIIGHMSIGRRGGKKFALMGRIWSCDGDVLVGQEGVKVGSVAARDYGPRTGQKSSLGFDPDVGVNDMVSVKSLDLIHAIKQDLAQIQVKFGDLQVF
ncbi:uncharacterized protein LOC142491215 isoform X2 [Ascaphus truei]|uniref:uncharacterized protein LOC142491215 isoform X2 n=1 Tax=Ascaphus truei TaxID=8439 RepID=UPI003F591B4B